MCSPVRWLVSFGCFVLSKRSKGWSSAQFCAKKTYGCVVRGPKNDVFFLSKVFLTKVSKIFSEFWKVHIHWNTAKLVKAPESGACSGFVSSSQTSLNLPPSPWNCRKDPFANGYCIRISYGSNTCPNRCRLRSFPEPSKLSTQKPFQGTFNRIL